ncbi:MAG: methylenetetrahydrofolate reductase [Betaproteobacteria bacterium]|jgi:methylenetetrahydrofolate reductase (NADPH)|nr:methylenetetrahydrofolate reductase [Betaproteobacteria bacterium]
MASAIATEQTETMMELATCGSLEMNADRAGDARTIADLLPAGTKVYVNHLPRNALSETLRSLEALRTAGLEPVPHVAARRVSSRATLKRFLQQAVDAAGVRKILLIGGDDPQPSGPYRDSLGPLGDGLIAECGIQEVGLAGYPEGHARIPRAALARAMDEKLALASAQGLSAYVLTQFSFAPQRVIEYCAELAQRWPELPVYVGLAGPTEPLRLLRFAQRCGVSASLRALRAQGFGAARLVTHTDPGEQLQAVARYCAARRACNVVGVHLFSFGGVREAADWLNGVIAGRAPAD